MLWKNVEAGGIRFCELVEHPLGHLGVTMDAASPPALSQGEGAEALRLDITGTDDTLTNLLAGLAGLHLTELGKGNGLNFTMDIDTVEDYVTPYHSKNRLCEKRNYYNCSDYTD